MACRPDIPATGVAPANVMNTTTALCHTLLKSDRSFPFFDKNGALSLEGSNRHGWPDQQKEPLDRLSVPIISSIPTRSTRGIELALYFSHTGG